MAVLSLGIDSRRYARNFNWPLAIAPLLIAILGVLCIQSADLHDPDAAGEYKKQFLYIVLGVPLMFGFSLVDYRNWRRWAPALYIVNLLLLIFILRGGPFGARRAALDLARTARYVSAVRAGEADPGDLARGRALPPQLRPLPRSVEAAARRGIPALLILKQPDLGTALVIGAILTVQLFFGLPKLGDFAIYAMAVLTAGAAAVGTNAILKPFQKARLFVFLNPKPIRRAPATISTSRRLRSAAASGLDAACITARRRS